MRTKMLFAALVVSALASVTLLHSRAFAGLRTSVPVFISSATGAGFAYGALGSARNSIDPFQDIGCTAVYTGPTSPPLVTCTATNSVGLYRSCVLAATLAPFMAVRSLNDDTRLYFAWDATGQCTEIRTNNSSEFTPKL